MKNFSVFGQVIFYVYNKRASLRAKIEKKRKKKF